MSDDERAVAAFRAGLQAHKLTKKKAKPKAVGRGKSKEIISLLPQDNSEVDIGVAKKKKAAPKRKKKEEEEVSEETEEPKPKKAKAGKTKKASKSTSSANGTEGSNGDAEPKKKPLTQWQKLVKENKGVPFSELSKLYKKNDQAQ